MVSTEETKACALQLSLFLLELQKFPVGLSPGLAFPQNTYVYVVTYA